MLTSCRLLTSWPFWRSPCSRAPEPIAPSSIWASSPEVLSADCNVMPVSIPCSTCLISRECSTLCTQKSTKPLCLVNGECCTVCTQKSTNPLQHLPGQRGMLYSMHSKVNQSPAAPAWSPGNAVQYILKNQPIPCSTCLVTGECSTLYTQKSANPLQHLPGQPANLCQVWHAVLGLRVR